jgi:hypothetical protein
MDYPEVILQKALYAIGVVYHHEFILKMLLWEQQRLKNGNLLPQQTLKSLFKYRCCFIGAVVTLHTITIRILHCVHPQCFEIKKRIGSFTTRPIKTYPTLLNSSFKKRNNRWN